MWGISSQYSVLDVLLETLKESRVPGEKSIIECSSLSFYLPPNSPKLPSKVPSGVAALE